MITKIFFIFITDNAMIIQRDIDTTNVARKNTSSVNETSVNIPVTTDTVTGVDHTFLTNNEKLDYLIGESYITVEIDIKKFI